MRRATCSHHTIPLTLLARSPKGIRFQFANTLLKAGSGIEQPPAFQPAAALLLATVLAGAGVAACSNDGSVAESSTDGSRPAPSLGVEKFLRLGDDARGDSLLFGFVSDIAVDASGRVIVAERQDPRLMVFSPEGKLLDAFGTWGEGPGEYQNISSVHAGPGDSLYVFDLFLERLTVVEPRHYLPAYTLPIQVLASEGPSELLGVTPHALVFRFVLSTGQCTEHERRFSTVRRINRHGTAISEPVLNIETAELFVTVTPQTRRSENVPFGRSSVVRMGPEDKLYSGWNESIDIEVHALDEEAHRRITHAHEAVTVTIMDRETALARGSDKRRKRLRERDLHDTWPAYETFVVDDTGAPG